MVPPVNSPKKNIPVEKKALQNLGNVVTKNKSATRTYWDVLGFILFGLIFFAGWWAYINRDQIMRPDPPVQASVYLGTQPISTPDPTEIFFADPELVRELTANPLSTIDGGSFNSETNFFNTTITPDPGLLESQTATVTETPIPTEVECNLPDGWISFVVRSGDTLFSLADFLDVDINQLRQVNCLDSDVLAVGQVIFLPDYPVTAIATPTRTPTWTATIRYYTATRTPTFTPTATRTRIPATNTFTPTFTNTPLPTSTHTLIPSNTALPTATRTETLVPTPTPTNTPIPTATPTNTPPPTDTPYPSDTLTN